MILVLLLCYILGSALAQPHAGPGIACYNCGGPHDDMPECLSHPQHNCHHEEVCQINYGGHKNEIKCHREHDCTRQLHESHRQCSTGGALVHDSCQICCQDNACVEDAIKAMNSVAGTDHMAVHCPADCDLDNLAACISRGHLCNNHQYCMVTMDENNNRLHAWCEEVHEIQHCQDQLREGHCDPEHHECVIGCCTNDSCVAATVGAPTSDLWELLKGDCQDQIPASQCAALDTSEHLCNDRLAVRLCPQTCGLCSAFHADDCKDTVQNGGCQALVISEDICSSSVAKHICPVTCNMCDALLEDKIKEAMANARSTTTAAPVMTSMMTTAEPDVTTTAGGSVFITCSDLATQSCTIVSVLCATLDCPDICGRCSTSAAPVVTDLPPVVSSEPPMVSVETPLVSSEPPMVSNNPPASTSAPVVDTSAPPMVTSAIPMDTPGPAVVDTTTAEPVFDASTLPVTTPAPDVSFASSTSLPVHTSASAGASAVHSAQPSSSSSGAPSVGTTTSSSEGACVDTITGMTCEDLHEPCTSPLLVNYCQKFCNLCS